MDKNLDSLNLFNPMAFWTDLSLRGLEMTLSSTQNITEGVDRLTRASASVEASEQIESPGPAASQLVTSATSSGLALAARMQQTAFDLMTSAWKQWMSTLGSMASLGTGRSFGETLARQNPWLSAVRDGLQLGSAGETPPTQALPGSSPRRQGGGRRKDHAETEAMEHALATSEPKRRSRGGRAKPKSRSRSS